MGVAYFSFFLGLSWEVWPQAFFLQLVALKSREYHALTFAILAVLQIWTDSFSIWISDPFNI